MRSILTKSLAHSEGLIDKGTFSPPTTPSAKALRYVAGIGFFLAAGCLNPYQGYAPAMQGKIDVADRRVYGFPNTAPVRAWMQFVKSVGGTKVLLTIGNEDCFLPYESLVRFNLPTIPITTRDGAISPRRDYPYHVQAGYGWVQLVDVFVSEAIRAGLLYGFYLNTTLDLNLGDLHIGNPYIPLERSEAIVAHKCRVYQEMVIRYRPDVMWFDLLGAYPAAKSLNHPQRYYNAVKAIDPTCLVAGNVGDVGTDLPLGAAYDIEVREEYTILYLGNTAYKTRTRTDKNGVQYEIPQEIVCTPYSKYSQWYYIPDGNRPDGEPIVQPVVSPFDSSKPFVKNALEDLSVIQGLMDRGKQGNSGNQYDCARTLNVFVDQYGQLVQKDLDFIRQLTF